MKPMDDKIQMISGIQFQNDLDEYVKQMVDSSSVPIFAPKVFAEPIIDRKFKQRGRGSNFTPKKKKRR